MSFKIEILLIPLLQAISHIFEISDDQPTQQLGNLLPLAEKLLAHVIFYKNSKIS
jgi:hypothetical protein